jgi:uncharacterized protein (TIGR03089 family)
MDLLGAWARPAGGAGRPFITYYDLATGERTELSGTTTQNWVAKAANLLTDECDAGPGTHIAVALPSHWMRYVWLLATWAIGATVSGDGADIIVVGPDLNAEGSEGARFRLASALRPFGARFDRPVAGFVDLGEALPGQPDAFFPFQQEDDSDVAVALPGRRESFAALSSSLTPSPARLALRPDTLDRDIDAVVAAARGGGSIVLVTNASDEEFERVMQQEHAQLP